MTALAAELKGPAEYSRGDRHALPGRSSRRARRGCGPVAASAARRWCHRYQHHRTPLLPSPPLLASTSVLSPWSLAWPGPIVVLLICADRESASRLAAAIQPRGHRVVAAPFGPIALEKAPGAQLIVMDRVDGTADAVAAVQRIKGTLALAALPLLAIAQGDDAEERIRLLEAGADDVVSRPVDPVELRLRIDTLLVRVPEATVVAPTPASVVAEPNPARAEGGRVRVPQGWCRHDDARGQRGDDARTGRANGVPPRP